MKVFKLKFFPEKTIKCKKHELLKDIEIKNNSNLSIHNQIEYK